MRSHTSLCSPRIAPLGHQDYMAARTCNTFKYEHRQAFKLHERDNLKGKNIKEKYKYIASKQASISETHTATRSGIKPPLAVLYSNRQK